MKFQFDQLVLELLKENKNYDPGADGYLESKNFNLTKEIKETVASMLKGEFSLHGVYNTDIIQNLRFEEGVIKGTHFTGGNFACKLNNIKPQNVSVAVKNKTK
jgi:hypothetical protein